MVARWRQAVRLRKRRFTRDYFEQTMFVVGVLVIGVPLAIAQAGFYWLRKRMFGAPWSGDWNMEDVRNRLHSHDS